MTVLDLDALEEYVEAYPMREVPLYHSTILALIQRLRELERVRAAAEQVIAVSAIYPISRYANLRRALAAVEDSPS